MDHPPTLTSDIIGRESEAMLFEVERGAIRKFAEAVQDQTPACLHGDVAPPTFPTTFRMTIPGVSYDLARVLHGAQEYRYERPLRAGDRVRCRVRVADVYRRQGRLGEMTFLILVMEGRDESGTSVFTGTTTAILR
ncbi:MAG TPA: MaoC family dehydratase N-terminal domain-containing protein [Candidatus Dormibacteraeota bacterium]|nr:MaoC family dehydratase N-terminal domain-containing protein [Candidatus Dormibacteraeota bacterium]